jgi:hypothetical protein
VRIWSSTGPCLAWKDWGNHGIPQPNTYSRITRTWRQNCTTGEYPPSTFRSLRVAGAVYTSWAEGQPGVLCVMGGYVYNEAGQPMLETATAENPWTTLCGSQRTFVTHDVWHEALWGNWHQVSFRPSTGHWYP